MNLQNIQILFLLLDSVIMLTPWRTMNMDKMIGKDFEAGLSKFSLAKLSLAKLKRLAER